jgi:hypothetical protein
MQSPMLTSSCRPHSQGGKFVVPSLLLTGVLVLSIFGSLFVASLLVAVQISVEIKNNAKLKRLKYAASGAQVVCKSLSDPAAFHLFLSHAWPARKIACAS